MTGAHRVSRWFGSCAHGTAALAILFSVAACGPDSTPDLEARIPALAYGTDDYCSVPEFGLDVLAERPGPAADPIDDVNWFARPVPHDGDDWIIAFASHSQNYIYNLTTDRRVQIPDRSDAVATPDGRYMTVPSYYTSDSNIRFYPVAPMLEALEEGRDVPDLEPAFIHDHPALHRVYYQSTALVSEAVVGDATETTYRMMFSGTQHESQFRIADYVFRNDRATGELLGVTASDPMAVCPAVQNDLNTPFISKDGRYIAAYTSAVAGNAFTPGSSLKVFEITSVDPASGTTTCAPVLDLGFAAGKADFSFDGSMLTFHLSQGAYLTPFVNGGLPGNTITDVVVARLEHDETGRISGYTGLQRLSTSLEAGSYFPSFFDDGRLFFISNTTPRDSEAEKRFSFRVVDPAARGWRTRTLAGATDSDHWAELGRLWQAACIPPESTTEGGIFPLDAHEIPLQAMSLTPRQCEALVRDARTEAEEAGGADGGSDWDALAGFCRAIEP